MNGVSGKYLRDGLVYRPTTLIFKSIKLVGIPSFSKGTCVPFFTLRQGPEQVLIYKSKVYEGIGKDKKEAVLVLEPPSPVCGDVKVEFFHKTSGVRFCSAILTVPPPPLLPFALSPFPPSQHAL